MSETPHDEDVSRAQTRHHEDTLASHHDKDTLPDPDKGNSGARTLTGRDMETELKDIGKLSDGARLKALRPASVTVGHG